MSDLIRLAIIGSSFLLLGMTFLVWRLYLGTVMQMRREKDRRNTSRARAEHVVEVVTSYILFLVGANVAVIERIGTDFTWRLVIFPLAIALGIDGIRRMLTALRRERGSLVELDHPPPPGEGAE